jgi:hypothetical protein
MISRRFIVWAVSIMALLAIAYSDFAYDVAPAVFWNWLGTLLATFISVLAAVVVGLLLFNYQSRVTDERKRLDLALLAGTELREIINTLQPEEGTETFASHLVHSPMVEQAARSGLFSPQLAAEMTRLAWTVQHYNWMVSQYQTVMFSMGTNPNADAFSNLLRSLCSSNRDVVLDAARIVLRDISEKYPEAFAPN